VDGAESIRVLLVEDNVANQKLGKFMLSKRGFVVVTASDGVEAVDTITADGAARRAAGAAPAAGAGGAAAPTRRLITLTTKRSSGGRGSLGGSGSAVLSSLPANLVSSTDNTPSPSSSFSVPSGPGGGGLTRTSSLVAATGSASVSSAAFGPSITTITVESAGNGTGTSSPQSAAVTSQDVGLTPPSSGRPGAASVGAEPSAFDASYSSFDLVLMDLSMPRLSGIQATQLLRSAGFSGRILALTASDSDAQRGACIEAGMDGFLVSSFTDNLCSFGEACCVGGVHAA
jgi:CheY-like chemotaxis protein